MVACEYGEYGMRCFKLNQESFLQSLTLVKLLGIMVKWLNGVYICFRA